jgi:hypothetical protein
MAVQAEGNYLNDLLKWELENLQSREKVTVLSGQNLIMGEVVGKITKSIPTTGTAGTNTGGGTCTSVSGGAKTKIGKYMLVCTATATNGGTFRVVDPEGYMLPNAVVGTAYNHEQIKFILNDGTPDFVVNDSFIIEVMEGPGKVKAIDFAAVDGSQDAFGFMIGSCDASQADTEGVAIVRDAQIVADYLSWPTGATAGQKAAALAQLYDKGIVTRDEA